MADEPAEKKVRWPHAPPHFLAGRGTFMVTAGTYGKFHYFGSRKRLRFLTELLVDQADIFGWRLEAWAVMANHYHWVGVSPDGSSVSLREFVAEVHRHSGRFVNELDGTPGRKVWHNYMESRLTFEKSYYARLNYVHRNPVKHGIVAAPEEYPWCSASWFAAVAAPALRKTVESFGIDRVRVDDDF